VTTTIQLIILGFAIAIGAVVGSFLNVVIWRVPRGENVAFPASHCGTCEQPIPWYHNIPVISWILLRGRCASCEATISPRYLMVELVTAALAVACVRHFGVSALAFRAFFFAAALVALTYIDLEHWILPHAITWPSIAVGLATAWVLGGPGTMDAVLGAAAGFAGFALLQVVAEWLLKKEALGGGDLFLLAMVGAFLGWQVLLPVVFLASIQGSVVGLGLILAGRLRGGEASAPGDPATENTAPTAPEDEEAWEPPAHALPFGPFLSLAALEMLFLGERLFAYFFSFAEVG